jgi:hypothetical protein
LQNEREVATVRKNSRRRVGTSHVCDSIAQINLDATTNLSQMERQIGEAGRAAECCLAEVKGHNATSDLQDLAALIGSSWLYETAAGVLKQLSGVHLLDERLHQLTNEQRSALARQQY